MTITELTAKAHQNAYNKGFWDLPPGVEAHNISEKLMLVVSELAEAQEELRSGRAADEVYSTITGKPEGFGVELADAVIRIADLCGYLGIDLEQLIEQKMAYNASRPHKHGRKF